MQDRKMILMSELNLTNKRVMIREDLNVPIHEGRITSDERIQRALPSLRMLLKQTAAVIVLSHFGRPKEGEWDAAFSLKPVADALSSALKTNVVLIKNW